MRFWLSTILAIGASACAFTGSRPAFIDLTSVKVVDSGDGTLDNVSMSGIPPHSRPAPPPLRVELLRLDRTRYRPLDPIVYDVKVTNTSTQRLLLPISASPIARRDRPATGYRSALFTLLLVNTERREVRVHTFGIYGAPNRARTLRALDPADSVTLRIPATLYVFDWPTPTDTSFPMPASVRARVELQTYLYGDPQTPTFQDLVSSAPLDSPIDVVNPAPVPLAPYREPPVLQKIDPPRTSPGASIDLLGLRLGVDRRPEPVVTFISANGEVQRRVRNGGASYTGNNLNADTQQLSVSVPEDLSPGTWNVVIERDGRRSAPLPVEVGEWAGPFIERLTRTAVNPGTFLEVSGGNFREGDTLEITDARGVVHSQPLGASSDVHAFEIPLNVSPGEATVQVRPKAPRNDAVSEKLAMTITTIPLPLDWLVGYMRSVAPGQWTRLALHSRPASDWWERIDVEFSQLGQTRVVVLQPSDEYRLQVPRDLAAGEVTLRGRVVHGSDASPWSEPQRYIIATRPVPPILDVVDVGAAQQSVYLSSGPDKPAEFLTEAGDELRIGGDFPMSPDAIVDVSFESAGTRRRVTASRDRTGKLFVRTPRDLAAGVWKIVVSVRGLPPVEVPISMRIQTREIGGQSRE